MQVRKLAWKKLLGIGERYNAFICRNPNFLKIIAIFFIFAFFAWSVPTLFTNANTENLLPEKIIQADGWSNIDTKVLRTIDSEFISTTINESTLVIGFTEPENCYTDIISVSAKVSIYSAHESQEFLLGLNYDFIDTQVEPSHDVDKPSTHMITSEVNQKGRRWLCSDLENIELTIKTYNTEGKDGDWKVDKAWLEVEYSPKEASINQRSYRWQYSPDNIQEELGPDMPLRKVEIGQHLALRIQLDNTGQTDSVKYNYILQYSEKENKNCHAQTQWHNVTDSSPISSVDIEVRDKNILDPKTNTSKSCGTGKCTEFIPAFWQNKDQYITITSNHNTELGFTLDTINANVETDYCLRLVKEGEASTEELGGTYFIYPEINFQKEKVYSSKKTLEAIEKPEIKVKGSDYLATEVPNFELEYFETLDATDSYYDGIVEETRIFKDENFEITTEVFDSNNNSTDIEAQIMLLPDGHTYIELPQQNNLKPGKYTLKVEVEEKEYATFNLEQDFTWGVLAINTNKASYIPGESANILMTILDNGGYTVCDADVQLKITSPSSIETILSNSDGTILNSLECAPSNFTYTPDYSAVFNDINEIGTYNINITANTQNGQRDLSTKFEVKEELDFDIERTGPVRIYPWSDYEMKISIRPSIDFTGEVEELVPSSFLVSGNDFSENIAGDTRILKWDVDWKSDNTYELIYTFDAPNISPEFFLLGPLEIGEYREIRQWQIASDATINSESFEDGDLVNDSAITDADSTWDNQTGDDCDWLASTDGTTPSGSTGHDTQGAQDGNNVAYIETSSGAACNTGSFTALLQYDSSFDAGSYDITVDFYNHMYGAQQGTLHLDVNDGGGWVSRWSLTGNQGDQWNYASVDLSTWYTSGNIDVRFRIVHSGSTYQGDTVLDNIVVDGELRNESPAAPTLHDVPFDNEKTGDSTPDFEFTGSDPDGTADIIYQIQIDDDYAFGSRLVDCESDTSCTTGAGSFTNTVTGGDTSPFNEGERIRFTPTTTMTTGTTYYWRVRAEDDSGSGGSGGYGDWSTIQSVTYVSATSPSEWFQTTDEQFDTGTLTGVNTNGSDQVELGTSITATGGTTSESGGYKYHTFTSSGTFEVTAGSGDVEVLVVGGGGGGGSGGTASRGGGGAGGLVYDSAYAVVVDTYTVTIGGGGGAGTAGSNSVFETLTALGGGLGSSTHLNPGGNGGSGGGGSGWSDSAGGTGQQPGSGSGGFGSDGGAARSGTTDGASGGGGGAGAVGATGSASQGGDGGVGKEYSQFSGVGGSPAGWFGGGGGGGASTAVGTAGSGGQGGGGAGGSGVTGTAGTTNTGGGGGGSTSTGGAGGSGIVIVRYSTSGGSSGTIMSSEIDFDWITGQSSWGTAAFSTTETNGDVKLRVYYTVSTACDTIVPDGALSGNSSGFDVSASPISISSLTPVATTYNKICLQATLTDSGGTPYLNDWTVTTSSTDVIVSSIGTQTSSVTPSTSDFYVGGAFVIKENSSSRNVTGITIAEQGTIDADDDLSNVDLYYETSTDCSSESFSGFPSPSESNFGSTTTFNADNGTASFTGSVAINTAGNDEMCVYVVFDVGSGASGGEDIEIQITTPNTQVTVSTGTVGPTGAVAISGTTSVLGDVHVTTEGTQTATLYIPGKNDYVGGMFVLTENTSNRNVTGITIAEQGTVDADDNLENIRLYYETSTDCSSESYGGSESPFGTSTSFNGDNGTASFTGSVNITTAGNDEMCVYVVLDVGSDAGNTDTLEVQITTPNSQVTVSSGTVSPSSAVAISGTTDLDDATVTGSLVKSEDGWGGAIPVRMTLTNVSNTEFPYARAKVDTAAAETYYITMTWDGGDSRFEGTIYIGSWYCNGCVDPTTGSFDVTVELHDDASYTSIDLSDATSGFSTWITRRKSSKGTTTDYSDYNAVWNTDHWDCDLKDFVMYASSTKDDVAVGIPFHPTTASISNIAVTFNSTSVSEGSAESTSDAWWWDSATHTLYVQNDSMGTTEVDVDVSFDSDTDLMATRFDRVQTSDMGNREFYNGLYINNQYWTTSVYGGGHEGAGEQAESRAHESTADNNTVDCMERVVVNVDDDETNCDSSSYYTCNIKWQQDQWDSYITSENNDEMVVVINEDQTASTGWEQYLDNDISVERTQVFYAGETYVKNVYEMTNGDSSSHDLPLVWEREQWLGGDRATGDEGRYDGDSSDVSLEQRNTMTSYTCPWMTAYDTGYYDAMGVIFDDQTIDSSTYGVFAVEAFITNTGGTEWPIVITEPHGTQTADQTGFEHTFSTVTASQTVDITFWQFMYDTTSWANIETKIDNDCEELNPDVTVTSEGTQTSSMNIPSTNQYVGGMFVLTNNESGTEAVTGITITEQGTVDADDDLSNIELFFETAADCSGQSYGGGESEFGSDTTFNASNKASFTDSENITTGNEMCVYVILDVDNTANDGDTLEIEISDPTTEVTLSSGEVGPKHEPAIEISGTTDLEVTNTAPNSPTNLAQTQTDDTNIVVADWTDETSVKFTASASDTDNPDTLQLCIEIDQLGTGFSDTEDSCGTGVAYSGSPVAVNHTIGSLTQGQEYHWQARVKDAASEYSSWVSFSSNTESERDVGIDNTGPGTGNVYDGSTIGSDADQNDGSLTIVESNWANISDSQSGISKYQYAIGTTSGGTDIVNWKDKSEPGNVFSDEFESADLTGWDANANDSGDLAATTDATYIGLYGAEVNIDDGNSIYVQDNFTSTSDYYGRFYINPNSLTMTSGDTFTVADIRSSTTVRASVELNYDGANHRVRGVLETGPQTTSWVNIGSSSWSSVELRWFADASGRVELWVNGVQYNSATGNTASLTVDNIMLGMVSDRDAGTSSSFYIDKFTSDNASYNGPHTYFTETISTSGHLHTGQNYYTAVRAVNNAETTGSTTNSDGIQVLPTLSFSLDTSSINFLNLNVGNSWTDTKTNQTTASTNAYHGYIATLWTNQNLTNTFDGSYTIPNYAGTNETPTTWTGTGFGYTTNDSSLSGGTADRFTNGGPKYAGFASSGEGDPVCDHTALVTGTTGAVSSENFTITYRVTSEASQAAGPYTANIIYIVTPTF
ncbi:glycine-rich domain-containing protein [Patescibacteria group bacterium]